MVPSVRGLMPWWEVHTHTHTHVMKSYEAKMNNSPGEGKKGVHWWVNLL